MIKRACTSAGSLWFQGFATSAANPKAVLFFAALFPPFISSEGSFWRQLAILSATYLVVDGVFLTIYGGGATWIARRMSKPAKLWLDRLFGSLLISAGILLGLKSAPR